MSKRILMRTNVWPEKKHEPEKVIFDNLIGCNIGNMLFPRSVARWIHEEDATIEITGIRDSSNFSAEVINQSYDMVLLPFANAFRADYVDALKKWTTLIKKLTIPCVVVGIGMQKAVNSKEMHFSYDEAVLDFCQAVLERSNTIGVRGSYTKEYLVGLGLPEERIHIIGCPSFYMNGKDLVLPEKKAFEELKTFSFNTSKRSLCIPYLGECMKQYPDHYFITQEEWEMQMLYTGYQDRDIPKNYFLNTGNPEYESGKMITFPDSDSWLSFLNRSIDLSIGTRIHGNIAAWIAGVPALIIAFDTRVKELAQYHGLPYKTMEELTSVDDLKAWYEEIDFEKIRLRYEETRKDYQMFMEENGIPAKAPEKRLDLNLPEEECDVIRSIHILEIEEQRKRTKRYLDFVMRRRNHERNSSNTLTARLRNENKDLIAENQALKEQNRKLQMELDTIQKESQLKKLFRGVLKK